MVAPGNLRDIKWNPITHSSIRKKIHLSNYSPTIAWPKINQIITSWVTFSMWQKQNEIHIYPYEYNLMFNVTVSRRSMTRPYVTYEFMIPCPEPNHWFNVGQVSNVTPPPIHKTNPSTSWHPHQWTKTFTIETLCHVGRWRDHTWPTKLSYSSLSLKLYTTNFLINPSNKTSKPRV